MWSLIYCNQLLEPVFVCHLVLTRRKFKLACRFESELCTRVLTCWRFFLPLFKIFLLDAIDFFAMMVVSGVMTRSRMFWEASDCEDSHLSISYQGSAVAKELFSFFKQMRKFKERALFFSFLLFFFDTNEQKKIYMKEKELPHAER